MIVSGYWLRQLDIARALNDKELQTYALVSLRNNHQCVDCFTCACRAVRDERRALKRWAIWERVKQ